MMRLFLLSLLLPAFLCARARTSGYCEQGGATVHTGASFSQTKVQQSFPGCTVKVYMTGGASGSVSTSGVAVTWVSGVQFNSNWAGGTIVISSVQYLIQFVASSTSITLVSSAGTQTAATYSMPLSPAVIYSDNAGTLLSNPFTADLAFDFNSIPKWRLSTTTLTFPDGTTQTTSAHSATGFTGAVVTGGCTMNFTNGVLQSKSGC